MLRAGEYKGVFGRDLMFCIIVKFLDAVTAHNALFRSEIDDDEFPRPSRNSVTWYRNGAGRTFTLIGLQLFAVSDVSTSINQPRALMHCFHYYSVGHATTQAQVCRLSMIGLRQAKVVLD